MLCGKLRGPLPLGTSLLLFKTSKTSNWLLSLAVYDRLDSGEKFKVEVTEICRVRAKSEALYSCVSIVMRRARTADSERSGQSPQLYGQDSPIQCAAHGCPSLSAAFPPFVQ